MHRDFQNWLIDKNGDDDAAGAGAIVNVRAICAKSKLFHTTAVEERVAAAIAKSMGNVAIAIDTDIDTTGSTDSTSTATNSRRSRPTVELLVRVHRDVVTLSIDTSPTPIHQRGYRLETAKAPLREDIAFSMLYATGLHDSSSNYQKLFDPMCGSAGTIVDSRPKSSKCDVVVPHSDVWNDDVDKIIYYYMRVHKSIVYIQITVRTTHSTSDILQY